MLEIKFENCRLENLEEKDVKGLKLEEKDLQLGYLNGSYYDEAFDLIDLEFIIEKNDKEYMIIVFNQPNVENNLDIDEFYLDVLRETVTADDILIK